MADNLARIYRADNSNNTLACIIVAGVVPGTQTSLSETEDPYLSHAAMSEPSIHRLRIAPHIASAEPPDRRPGMTPAPFDEKADLKRNDFWLSLVKRYRTIFEAPGVDPLLMSCTGAGRKCNGW